MINTRADVINPSLSIATTAANALTDEQIEQFYLLISREAANDKLSSHLRNKLLIITKHYFSYASEMLNHPTHSRCDKIKKDQLITLLKSINKDKFFEGKMDESIINLIIADITQNGSALSKRHEEAQNNLLDRLCVITAEHTDALTKKHSQDEKTFFANTKLHFGLESDDRVRITSSANNTNFFFHQNKHQDAYTFYLSGLEAFNKKNYIDAIKKYTAAYEMIAHECFSFNVSCQRNLNCYKDAAYEAKRKLAALMEQSGSELEAKEQYPQKLKLFQLSASLVYSIERGFRTPKDEELVVMLQKDIASLYYCMGNDLFNNAMFTEALAKYKLAVNICSSIPTDSQTSVCLPMFKECVDKTIKSINEAPTAVREYQV